MARAARPSTYPDNPAQIYALPLLGTPACLTSWLRPPQECIEIQMRLAATVVDRDFSIGVAGNLRGAFMTTHKMGRSSGALIFALLSAFMLTVTPSQAPNSMTKRV